MLGSPGNFRQVAVGEDTDPPNEHRASPFGTVTLSYQKRMSDFWGSEKEKPDVRLWGRDGEGQRDGTQNRTSGRCCHP
jgi:hypothetical protein